MPIGAYYKGHGDEVMSEMQRHYGDKKGKSVFYATANKKGLKAMDAGGVVGGPPEDPFIAEYDPNNPRDRRMMGQPPPPPPPGPAPQGLQPTPTNMPDLPQAPPQPPPPPPGGGVNQGWDDGPAPDPSSSHVEMQLKNGPVQMPKPGEAAPPPAPAPPPPAPMGGQQPIPPPPHLDNGPGLDPDQDPTPTQEEPPKPPMPQERPIGTSTTRSFGEPKVQGEAAKRMIAYGRDVITDPKTGKPKQPSVFKNILGALAQTNRFTRGMDVTPNLTRQYQNYAMLKDQAEEERKLETAQSAEETRRVQAMAAMARADKMGSAAGMKPARNFMGEIMDTYHRTDIDEPQKKVIIDGLLKMKAEHDNAAATDNMMTDEQMAKLKADAVRNPSRYVDAWNYMLTNKLNVRGQSKMTQSQANNIKALAGSVMNDWGLDPGELLARGAVLKGSVGALTKVAVTSAQMEAFESTLLKNAALAKELSKKFPRGDMPLYNRVVAAYKTGTGDAEARNLAAQLHGLSREWAKIMAGSTSATGVPVTEATALDAIFKGLSDGSLESLINNVIVKDARNRTDANNEQKQKLIDTIKGVTGRSAVTGAGPGPIPELASEVKPPGPVKPPSSPSPAPGDTDFMGPVQAAPPGLQVEEDEEAPAAKAGPAPPVPGPTTPAPKVKTTGTVAYHYKGRIVDVPVAEEALFLRQNPGVKKAP